MTNKTTPNNHTNDASPEKKTADSGSGDEREIRVSRRSLSDYQPDPHNANAGTDRGRDLLRNSLHRLGPGRSVVVDANGYLAAGNKTVESAKAEGWQEVIEVEAEADTLVVVRRADWNLLDDDPENPARQYAYLDDRTGEICLNWDAAQIAADIENGLDLGAMFDPGELALLIGNEAIYGDDVADTAGAADPDADDSPTKREERLAELREKWHTETGQLWEIPSKHGGVHRVLCGSCQDADAVQRLFDGQQAQIAVTSPPYAQQRASTYGGIPEDEYIDWWQTVQEQTRAILTDNGSFFVNIKPHARDGQRVLYVFDLVLAMVRRWNWLFVDEHCWQRHTAPGRWPGRLKNEFEPVYQFAVNKGGVFEPERVGTHSDAVMVSGNPAEDMTSTGDYYNISHDTQEGLALPSNVFRAFGTRSGMVHDAQYPVALPTRFMLIYSNPGDIVFDPFLGSGTNIHAAESIRRLSYGAELMPEHVAEILDEWSRRGYEPQLVEPGS